MARKVWTPLTVTERRDHLMTLARLGLLVVHREGRKVAFVLMDAGPEGLRHELAPRGFP